MPDHPRSRGVYSTMISILFIRGDHPRSRGVYHAKVRTRVIEEGSSPLARGLQFATNTDVTQRRIIPARAGFTRPDRAPRSSWTDHPRSRGVYASTPSQSDSCCGSSPLARGLRRRLRVRGRHPRIIPARAGFTTALHGECFPEGDHPRSRGVYGAHLMQEQRALGSSPLARGLRSYARPWVHWPRIIPARAGFTTKRADYNCRVKDHPRSRGVYY